MKIGRRLSPKDKGFTETITQYAWTPTFMTSGDLVWLENYEETRTWDYSPSNIWRTVGIWKWNIVKREQKWKA